MDRADPLRQKGVETKKERPGDWGDLAFTRQKAVKWFSPAVLAASAQRVVVSSAFGGFLDKRELQQALSAEMPTAAASSDEVWFDFISDTGDGFDATYSVAWLAAQPSLALKPGTTLPRGELLILGGDEVYPLGSSSEYENRFTRPFEASLPYTRHGSPTMLVIPGNHDWYDGLTSFTRVFCQGKWIGGRRTVQTRSYFAVELVADWWLWGIDIQFDSYIDEPQLQFFEQAAKQMSKDGRKGRVILCTAKPSWVDVRSNRESFRNLAYLESRLIKPAGARLVLSLSGDSHHYAHYEAADGSHKLTAGGGGAFLHPTHHLDEDLDVPETPDAKTTQRYWLSDRRYPSKAKSRQLSWKAVLLPWYNPTFLFLPAALYLLLGIAGSFTVRSAGDALSGAERAQQFGFWDVLGGLLGSPLSAMLLLLVWLGLIGFAKAPESMAKGMRRTLVKVAMGSVHAVGQILVGVGVSLVAIELAWPRNETAFGALYLVWLVILGSVAASLAMGAYLAVCCWRGRAHGNEAFSAVAMTGYKNFLRIHISAEGVLTAYPVGLDRANRRWRVDGTNDDEEAPWVAPVDEAALTPRLIDEPIVIDPRATPPGAG